jgi:hypothetical protein
LAKGRPYRDRSFGYGPASYPAAQSSATSRPPPPGSDLRIHESIDIKQVERHEQRLPRRRPRIKGTLVQPTGRSLVTESALALPRRRRWYFDRSGRAVRYRGRSNEHPVCDQALDPLRSLLHIHFELPAYFVGAHGSCQQLKEKLSGLREKLLA